jgi:LPS-assembly protein
MKIFRLKPAAAILFSLFPTCSQAAVNLPLLAVDPELLSVPAKLPSPVSARREPAGFLVRPATAERSDAVDTPPHLKRNRKLTLEPPVNEPPTPIIIQAMRIQGHKDAEVEAFDDAELRQWGRVLSADHLIYRQPEDEVFAEGNVRIEQKQDVAEGSELRLELEKKQGYMNASTFDLSEQEPPGRGSAAKLLFEGDNHYRLEDTNYTTCPMGADDWFLRASELDLNRNTQIGTAYNARLEFLGVPILYTPWMSFPLDKARKSGFLAPSFGSTGGSGSEFTLPYYWNIAPNRDATISPRLMQKRGLQLNNELRYLDDTYHGEVHAEILPNDRLLDINRYYLSFNHWQALAPGLTGMLNLQKASDNDYFRDLGTQLAATSQIILPREGVLSYTLGGWNLVAHAQTFQTLQDPSAPVTPPYNRTPQLLLNGGQHDVLGTDLALTGEFVNFIHPDNFGLPDGRRTVFYPSISLPMTESYGFLTPKLGWHTTRYTLDPNTTSLPDTTRNLPIFSLDGALNFERETGLFGRTFLQTLEPRLYYLNIPYRDQSQIPNFDSGEADFNYARLFTENRFSGSDRINDANHLTMAVTSRLLESESGWERIRATLGQRYYFRDQLVTLPGTPAITGKTSDILALLSGNISSQWSLDSGWQYNPGQKLTEKLNLAARYQPEAGKTLNMGYRYTREALKQLDISGQWPIGGGWHALGRWNYSLPDSKLIEGLVGAEYNAGCWVFRSVVHSFSTATEQKTNAIFFELELNGIGQIGSNPLDILKRNIYGYTKSNETHYEPTDFR